MDWVHRAVLLDVQAPAAGLDLSTVISDLNIRVLTQLSKAIILLFYKILQDTCNLGYFTKYFNPLTPVLPVTACDKPWPDQ